MRRGELWTISGGPGYAGKPRPALIIQDDLLVATNSLVLSLVTTEKVEALRLLRPMVEPTPENGLRAQSFIMTDKLVALPRSRLGRRIGALAADELAAVEAALLVLLGLAAATFSR